MKEKIILLVDDDYLNRRLSKKILMENLYTVFEAKNASETFNVLSKHAVDLIVLDINLGENELDGISLGQQIKDKYDVPFIYLTAYENLDVINSALLTSPYSYLTKPFKNLDLIISVEIAIKQSSSKVKNGIKIFVKDGDYTVELSMDEINYIESDGNYLLFYTDKKTYKSRATIKQILETLPEHIFTQVHRAYIINKTKVEKYNAKNVVVKGITIPASQNYISR